MFYSLINIDYSRSSNLTSSDKQENYVSNTANNNIDFEQAENKNLYPGCNIYHLETTGRLLKLCYFFSHLKILVLAYINLC